MGYNLHVKYWFDTKEEADEFVDDLTSSGEITTGKSDALYERYDSTYRQLNINKFKWSVSLYFLKEGAVKIDTEEHKEGKEIIEKHMRIKFLFVNKKDGEEFLKDIDTLGNDINEITLGELYSKFAKKYVDEAISDKDYKYFVTCGLDSDPGESEGWFLTFVEPLKIEDEPSESSVDWDKIWRYTKLAAAGLFIFILGRKTSRYKKIKKNEKFRLTLGSEFSDTDLNVIDRFLDVLDDNMARNGVTFVRDKKMPRRK